MLFELFVTDTEDRESLRHYLMCQEHQSELIARMVELMNRAAAVLPPVSVSMRVGEVPGTHSYRVVESGRAIRCVRCGTISRDLNHVLYRFCPHCQRYHDIPATEREDRDA